MNETENISKVDEVELTSSAPISALKADVHKRRVRKDIKRGRMKWGELYPFIVKIDTLIAYYKSLINRAALIAKTNIPEIPCNKIIDKNLQLLTDLNYYVDKMIQIKLLLPSSTEVVNPNDIMNFYKLSEDIQALYFDMSTVLSPTAEELISLLTPEETTNLTITQEDI